jgi:hypothetical protein
MQGDTLALASAAVLALTGMMGQRRGSRYRTEDEVLQIKSMYGTPYNLRVVPPGGSYGRNFGLTNGKPFALLEFWRPSTSKTAVQPWGTFTGERYRLPTLLERATKRGLSLQTDREGKFSPETMTRAVIWALGGNARAYRGSAKVLKATTQGEFHHIRMRSPEQFELIRTPDWAAHAASSIVDGAEVRTGRTSSGDWKIQAVLVPRARGRSLADAKRAAQQIQALIEG